MSEPTRRPCLLLVDDTPANIDVLVGLLRADYDLKIATGGERALALCAVADAADAIDLVLLDVMMPGMDGFEVCRRLRARPATHDLPVLFLTSRSEVGDVVEGFAVGGNDYLVKPFRVEELRARVRTHLLLRAQQHEIERKHVELKQLLHIMFHDLANHFAVLNIAVESVSEVPEELETEILPMMKTAVKNGVGLLDVVRDLERAEVKPLALSVVPLAPAIAEAVTLMRGRCDAKGVTLDVDAPAELQVRAEPSLLINSIISNLLTNAIKFSFPGSQVRVSARRDAACVRLSVEDHGVGMSEDTRRALFDLRQSRSQKGTAGEGGSGFGMPLMHRWVTRFGGRVEVESQDIATHPDTHGTTFTICLPPA